MTAQELEQQRARLWRVDGNPIRTVEDARSFIQKTGFCLMYPVRSLPPMPCFLAAYAGTSAALPDAKHAFSDPRNQPATELMVRLLRERQAYEIKLLPESNLLVSAGVFPFLYAALGDRIPRAAPKFNAQGGKLSPLELDVFAAIKKKGPLSKPQLQELIGRELSAAALDRALHELWSVLKITRVDYREREGAFWDLLVRWAPDAVKEGSHISASEAISALVGKYLEAVLAATREEIEHFFSRLSSRARVRDVVNALLIGRELSIVTIGPKTFIHLTPLTQPYSRRSHG